MKIPRLSLALMSNAAGKLVGFLRVQAIATTLGAAAVADALLMSSTVLAIFDVVFISGSAILVTQALYIRRQVGAAATTALALYARSTAMWVYGSLVFGVLMAALSGALVKAIAPGFTPTAQHAFMHFTILGAGIPAATALMNYVSALNRIHGREVLYTVNPIVVNSVSLLVLHLGHRLGQEPLSVARWFVLSAFGSTAFMIAVQARYLEPALRCRGAALLIRALKPSGLSRHLKAYARELARIAPIAGSLLLQQTLGLVSYAVASLFGQGALTIIGIGERLSNVVFALFTMTLLTILEPRWAREFAAPRSRLEVIHEDVLVIAILVIPLTATLMFAGDSLAALLFGYGAFTAQATSQLGIIAAAFAATLPGLSLGVVYARMIVLADLAVYLTRINLSLVGIHLVVCLALTSILGVVAIPISLAVTFAIQAAWYRAVLRTDMRLRSGWPEVLRQIAAVAGICAAAAYSVSLLGLPPIAKLASVAGVSALATFLSAKTVGIHVDRSIVRLARL